MSRFIKIEEIVFNDVKAQVPRKQWTAEEIAADQCERTVDARLSTGNMLIEMLSRPIDRTENSQTHAVSYAPRSLDFVRMRFLERPLDYLDADGDGECDLPLGSWAELEQPWYDAIWDQAQIWPFNSMLMTRQGMRVIRAMLEHWGKATDVNPLALKIEDIEKPVKNGVVERQAVEA